MWIRWSSQPAEAPLHARSTVPPQYCVPLSRTEVVRTATVAAPLEWPTTLAESKMIWRSPACEAAKLE
jgi:hypothetical protein